MFIETIKIENDGDLIREISFKRGLNLIVDETKKGADETVTGNNVGKTSVIRLVDFCLDGDGKNLYIDKEFPDKSNEEIKIFLTTNNIVVTLVLTPEFGAEESSKLVVRRNFLPRTKKILEINDESKTIEEFRKELSQRLFKHKSGSPTLKQLKAKNIRDEKNKVQNTLKVLNPYTTKSEYEALYLFLLGINTDQSERKTELVKEKNLLEKISKRTGNSATISSIEQSLIVIDRDITGYEKQKNEFVVNPNYEKDLETLNRIKSDISKFSQKISTFKLRECLIEESLEELNQEKSSVDIELIKEVYSNAQLFIPKLQKSFEETLEFHNSMIEQKKDYIARELPELKEEIMGCEFILETLLSDELKISEKLKETGFIEDLEHIISKLNKAYEEKGRLEEQKSNIHSTIQDLDGVERELKSIDEGLFSYEDEIIERVAKFNEYFTQISTELYDEQFILVPFKTEKGWDMKIDSVGANHGTGKKKGEIASFDLAYIQFADEMDIPCLHFVFQDQFENVHDTQISKLLGEIVERINCQYILPVLRDKLPDDFDVDKHIIVSLSQDDKLFRVP